jgi:hypothetical protein
MKRVIWVVGAALLIAGCATGAPGSARNICYKAGYQPGTEAFESCWKGERDRQFAGDAGAMLVGAAAGIAANPPAPQTVIIDNRQSAAQRPRSIMCPNGAWAYGTRCVPNPDGTWSGVP